MLDKQLTFMIEFDLITNLTFSFHLTFPFAILSDRSAAIANGQLLLTVPGRRDPSPDSSPLDCGRVSSARLRASGQRMLLDSNCD